MRNRHPPGPRVCFLSGRAAATAALVLVAAACSGGRDDVPDAPAAGGAAAAGPLSPAWPAGSEWRVGETVLEVGDDSDPLYGVVGALRRPGGGVVVAEGAGGRVRFFDPAGVPESGWGGEGDGPGEFRILQSLGRHAGDTIWAYDFSAGRITLLHPVSGAVGVLTLDPLPVRGLAAGGPRGEGWLVVEAWGDAPSGALRTGLRRDSVTVLRYGPNGILVDTVARLPGREVLITEEDGRAVMGAAPFGRNATVSAWGDAVVVGDQTERHLAVLTPEGISRDTLRWGGPPLAISSADARAWTDARLALVPPRDRDRAARDLAEAPLPDRRPAHGPALEGAGGELWVADFALPGAEPAGWTVLDADGRWLGRVAMPRGFRLLEVGEDWVVGLSRDGLGVERVSVRHLLRDRGAGRD
ncbi:MAG TPA: hypothetical protein VLA43_18740 [Longimicrobiales bacterium]|nr:hypothetical protein [Longimicrobiales bacterium]